ncbi:MAG: S9 family peptidase [bacterium]|nr:S9 family peptidase [bacterium]
MKIGFRVRYLRLLPVVLALLLIISINTDVVFAQKRAMTVEDFKIFRNVSSEKVSFNGDWVAYIEKPQEGDGKVIIINVKNGTEYIVERGSSPSFSEDSKWLICAVLPPEKTEAEKKAEREGEGEDREERERNKLAIVELKTGEKELVDRVSQAKFSKDSRWLAFKYYEPEKEDEEGEERGERRGNRRRRGDNEEEKKRTGTEIVLREIKSGEEMRYQDVMLFDFTEGSKYMYFSASNEDGSRDGIYFKDLKKKELPEFEIISGKGKYENLVWNEEDDKMFFFTDKDDQESEKPVFSIYTLGISDESAILALDPGSQLDFPDDKRIVSYQSRWAKDSQSIIFSIKDKEPEKEPKELDGNVNASVDIWHWKDVLLQPQQEIHSTGKATGSTFGSTRGADDYLTDRAIFNLGSRRFIRLTEEGGMSSVIFSPDDKMAIGENAAKHEYESPWLFDKREYDYYLIDLENGSSEAIEMGNLWGYSWSSTGKYLVQYDEPHWYVYDVNSKVKRNLTGDLDVAFWDTDDDRTDVKRAWGRALWTKDDEGVILYDKYDMWYFPVGKPGEPVNLTKSLGRENNDEYRYYQMDDEEEFIDTGKTMMLRYFDNDTKASGYYELRFGKDPKKLVRLDKSVSRLSKAEDSDRLMFRISSNQEYQDIWISDKNFKNMKKVSDANPGNHGFLWSTSQLIEYTNMDGVKLQAILELPENYVEGRKYPMIIYMYEKLTGRFHSYSLPSTGSGFRDSYYLSNGYIVLKPDIIYTDGHPGQSAVKCVVPAAKKAIDLGYADPERIAITGHSWGGYQVAYIITQTDMFACTYSGAPVGNMTSAYGGIRWGSGLPRQFQYERTQSRLDGSLWDVPERYIENSPVFFADRVNTPIMMMHGDEDTAVPWYQSIELFLALRRNSKPAWFLQYNNEPHGLRKAANKKDLTIRRMQFFDHYLKDAPMPDWMQNGVEFKDKTKKELKY